MFQNNEDTLRLTLTVYTALVAKRLVHHSLSDRNVGLDRGVL
jgi:hypothetical protein